MSLLLMYHRIAEQHINPWGLCVSPERFTQQLAVLASQARIVSLTDLAAGVVRSTDRTAVVTFDDGYVDNLYAAKPILEHFASPATVFVATVALDQAREFWWDELERVILHDRSLPSTLELPIGDQTLCWALEDASELLAHDWRAGRAWRAWDPSPSPRHALYLDLWTRIRPLSHDVRQSVLGTLAEWAAMDLTPRHSHRTASPSELRTLAAGGLVVDRCPYGHAPFAPLPVSQRAANRDIAQQGRARGNPRSCDSEFRVPVRLVQMRQQRHLFATAGSPLLLTTTAGPVPDDPDLLRLPRIGVQDWTGEEFSHRLAGWW